MHEPREQPKNNSKEEDMILGIIQKVEAKKKQGHFRLSYLIEGFYSFHYLLRFSFSYTVGFLIYTSKCQLVIKITKKDVTYTRPAGSQLN